MDVRGWRPLGAGGRPAASAPGGLTDAGGRPLRLLLRLSGEVATKSRRTRHRFHRVLAANLRDACRGSEGARVRDEWSRIFVDLPDAEALENVTRVFGISSWSPVEAECDARLDEIVRVGADRFGQRVRGRRFAVRARRSGRHPFGSQDVMRELGAALAEGASVDLTEPEVEVRVEVRDERAYLFSARHPGPGGLPLGVEGRAVALLSGGFDSAVASWLTLRRGVELQYVFCNLGGGAYRRLVLEVARALAEAWSWGTHPVIHVVDFAGVARALRAGVRPSHQQVALKRQMYRAAARVAAERGASAIVTGEAIGQVSTQTLANLRAIEPAAEGFPVLRPLLGFDKSEIIDLARRIGTHDLSARVREYCAISPGRPAVAVGVEAAEREEGRVAEGVVTAAVQERETLSLRGLADEEIVEPGLFVERIPPGAAVLDTRGEREYRAWHWPGAERCDFDELLLHFDRLDRERDYVLYCARGVQSAQLAERMQSAGYEAYSFRGGAPALRQLAGEAGAPAGAAGVE